MKKKTVTFLCLLFKKWVLAVAVLFLKLCPSKFHLSNSPTELPSDSVIAAIVLHPILSEY